MLEQSQSSIGELRNSLSSGLNLELYVGNDILQGEKVPFYIVWKDIGIRRITIRAPGFRRIVKLYNTTSFEEEDDAVVVHKDQLKLGGYLGGVLATTPGESSQEQVNLKVTLEFEDGTSQELVEPRTLFSVRARLAEAADRIELPVRKGVHPVTIRLEGAATAIISIKELPNSLHMGIPNEVASAMQRYGAIVKEGLEDLREEYPTYKSLIDNILDEKLAESIQKYVRTVGRELRKYEKDDVFMESISYVFLMALLEEESLRGLILLPLIEYFESSATIKAFLDSPLLAVDVPKGGGRLRCAVVIRDLLNHRCGKPIEIDMLIEAYAHKVVPIKDLIRFERV